LLESLTIIPIIDRIFPFEATNGDMAYVESGQTKGKVATKIKYKLAVARVKKTQAL
jgi:hypothetical protein